MTDMRKHIENATAVLTGSALWNCRRAADMAMFHFGGRIKTTDFQGKPTEVGDYALHIQCAWRIVREDDIVVGSQDLYYPAEYANESDKIPDSFDWDRHANRHDKLIRALFEDGTREFEVQHVEVGEAGSLHIALSEGLHLDVLPFNSLPVEHWRLFKPGSEKQHFVVTGHGIET